jgi:hypothetical protein
MIQTLPQLDLSGVHETLLECRAIAGDGDFEADLKVARLTGLTDEQIYCRWLTEINWITMGDDPGLFARMQIDEPIAYGQGDLQHLMIEAAESNPLWKETFEIGTGEIDEWRSDLTTSVIAVAEESKKQPKPTEQLHPKPKLNLNLLSRNMLTEKLSEIVALIPVENLLTQFKIKVALVEHTVRQLPAYMQKSFATALRLGSLINGLKRTKSESL